MCVCVCVCVCVHVCVHVCACVFARGEGVEGSGGKIRFDISISADILRWVAYGWEGGVEGGETMRRTMV